ncbi:hypothetical protein TNCV_1969691 [Trichonephila clavipes]|nr:hypothetical protein TNCV_1969691 [Trichonephila clavipes]
MALGGSLPQINLGDQESKGTPFTLFSKFEETLLKRIYYGLVVDLKFNYEQNAGGYIEKSDRTKQWLSTLFPTFVPYDSTYQDSNIDSGTLKIATQEESIGLK